MSVKRKRLVVLAVMLGLTVAVLRYTVFFNPVSFRIAIARTLPVAKFAPASLASAYHHGAPPCLRFADPALTTDDEADRVVDDLAAARLSDEVAHLTGFFLRWSAEDEATHHDLDEQTEYLARMKESAGWFDSLLILVNGRRMHDEARADAEAALLELVATAEKTEERLDAAQRAAVRPLWERHRLALTPRASGKLHRALARRRAQPRTADGR